MGKKKESERIGIVFWIGGSLSISYPLLSVISGLQQVEAGALWLTGLFTQFVIGGLIWHFVYVGIKKLFLALKGSFGNRR